MSEKKYITHSHPALISQSQYIAMVDLSPFGFDDLLEQVWLGERGDGMFEFRCIPFRIYGVSLLDIIRLENDVMVEHVRCSGHRTLRALIAPGVPTENRQEIYDSISSLAGDSDLLVEWSGDRHAAVDIPPAVDSSGLQKFFSDQHALKNIFWEWSDVKPFVPPYR